MRHSISEVSRRFDIAVSALRYYDEIGLLRPAGRHGTVRYYGREELRRLALIRLLHRDGLLPLAATATAIADPAAEPGDTRGVIEESIHTMRDQIERLTRARKALEHLLSCPRDNPVRDCPFLRAELEATVDAALADE
ncbi:MerR family transcriptional regulator [Stackebrandtia nassauensis]|uniref:Transcriptional regulator, MerR family n=1 Tax=Stackebrandtia nassauensis (strain DSM 44728 / CIP 108903 / NRRL B-16338 / NBRC 102104 / LLR-40K-21) TaxID=446470 RepID=D3Q2N6_STANL|nr:MerR family transcriptional regulator [Stackebrandtia nassauensis]ADD45787.1 transcriptional regulator, MerR family [Stackebrandtia nassauensis DSM 44728]